MTGLQRALKMYSNNIQEEEGELSKKITKVDQSSVKEAVEVLRVLDNIREECEQMESTLHRHTKLSEHFRGEQDDGKS